MAIFKLIVPLSLGLVLQAEGIIKNMNPYMRAFNNFGPPFDVIQHRKTPFMEPEGQYHDDLFESNIPIQDGIDKSTDVAGKQSVLDNDKDKDLKNIIFSKEQQAITTAFETTDTEVGNRDKSDLGIKGENKVILVPELSAKEHEHKIKSSKPSENATENGDKIIFLEEKMEILPYVIMNNQSVKNSENYELVTIKPNYSKNENITASDDIDIEPVNLNATSDTKIPDMNSRFGLDEADFILVPIGTVQDLNTPDVSTATRVISNNRRIGTDSYVPQKTTARTNFNYLSSDDRIYFPENVPQTQNVNQNNLLPQTVPNNLVMSNSQYMSPQQPSVISANQILATSVPAVGQVFEQNQLQSSNMPGLGNGIFHLNNNIQGNFMTKIPTNQQANMVASNNPYYLANNNQLYAVFNVPNNFKNGQNQNVNSNQLVSYPNINYNQLVSSSQPLQNTNTYQNQPIYGDQPSQNTNIFLNQPGYANQPMQNTGMNAYPYQPTYGNRPVQNSNWYPNQPLQSNLQNQNIYGNQLVETTKPVQNTLLNQNPQSSNIYNPGYNLVSLGNYPNNNVPTDVGNQLSGNYDAVTFPQNRNTVVAQNPNNFDIPFITSQMLLSVNNG